jgi:hypothetical protein
MKINRLMAELRKPRRFALPSRHELQHYEHYTHMTYLGMVGLESHYWYGKVALIGFAIAFALIFVRETGSAVEAAVEAL